MKNTFKKFILIPLFFLTFTSCAGTGTGAALASLVTVANIWGTWIALSGNPEGITEFTLSDSGIPDDVAVDIVHFDDGTTDVGYAEFTDGNNTNRGIRVVLSAGTFTGTVSLSDDCEKMNLTLEGESGTFEQSGNSCTDHAALVLDE